MARRRPFLAFVHLFSVALTMGVLLAAAALLEQALGTRPPAVHQRRTLVIQSIRLVEFRDGQERTLSSAYGSPQFLTELTGRLPGVEAVALASTSFRFNLFAGGRSHRCLLRYVDAAYFEILQFDFLAGRPFGTAEVESGLPLAVVSESTWRRLGGECPETDRSFEVDGRRFEVVGVVRDVASLRPMAYSDVWLPAGAAIAPGAEPAAPSREILGVFTALMLARDPGALPVIRQTLAQRLTAVDLTELAPATRIEIPVETVFELAVRANLARAAAASDRPTRSILARVLLAMLAFLLLPMVQLVNLNISRIGEWSVEIGLRRAFGAGPWQVAGRFLLESLELAAAGGLVAAALAWGLLALLPRLGWFPGLQPALTWPLAGVWLALVFLLGLAPGAYPAWRLARLGPLAALQGGGA